MNSLKKERLAIAKDALQQLDYSYVPYYGLYLQFTGRTESRFNCLLDETREEHSLQEFAVALPRKSCKVCAKGALFLSAVRLYNQYTINTDDFNNVEMRSVLKKYWSPSQVNLIEAFYENWRSKLFNEKQNIALSEFNRRFGRNEKTRMKGILNNIIFNQGNFDIYNWSAPVTKKKKTIKKRASK